MKRVFSQSESTSLPTGVKVSFKFNGSRSRVNVVSQKLVENSIFNQPIKQ